MGDANSLPNVFIRKLLQGYNTDKGKSPYNYKNVPLMKMNNKSKQVYESYASLCSA